MRKILPYLLFSVIIIITSYSTLAQFRIDSLNGPVTQNEINAYKKWAQGINLSSSYNPSERVMAYGSDSKKCNGLGLMYELTHDKTFLDALLKYTDRFLNLRNDSVTGTFEWTGKRELIWHPEDTNSGVADGLIVAKIAYAAQLILQNPSLWDQTVPDGNKFLYGLTYKDRALKYIQEMEATESTFLFKWYVRDSDKHIVFPDDPRFDGGFTPGGEAPYNQKWMILYGKMRMAKCYELLGNTTMAKKYRDVVQANLNLYASQMYPATYQGHDAYIWYYPVNNTRYIEDCGHAGMGIVSMHAMDLMGGYTGFPDRTKMGNAILYAVYKPSTDQWNHNVAGTNSTWYKGPENWVILMSRFVPDLYLTAGNDMIKEGQATSDPDGNAYILWCKNARYTGDWTHGMNKKPTVSIASPADNAVFTAPAGITINATAADADGSVFKVDFYNGTSLLGTDNTAPYSFSWNNVAAGTYKITAKAMDNAGEETASSVVTVIVNHLPTVNITSPANNAIVTAPATITINATAADTDGSISKVDFYNGTTLIGSDNTSPYSFTWSNVAAGTYTLTAKVTDNLGGITTSSSVKVIVNQLPVVSITSPVNNAIVSAPAIITINATATDADGSITKVEFYNGTTLLGTDNSSPYSFAWSNVGAGTYTITAKATDNSGGVTTSTSVAVIVNQLPVVSITSPASNTVIPAPANITINATATDADGSISKVDFYNGTTLLGTSTNSPYSFVWNNVLAGTYTITAKATDNSTGITTSTAVILIVNQVPTVNITSPTNGSVFTSGSSISFNTNATDVDGTVTKVAFYIDGTKIGETTSSPFNISWIGTSGPHKIKAIATDNRGADSKADSISIVVRGPYGGTAWAIPGKIEAENYDIGAEGVTFHDLSTGNTPNAYRTDNVDIQATTDAGGGYNIGYVQAGEWMEYTVNVTTAGPYILQVRVAATASGKTFHVEMDGQNISGAITIPNTGAYQTFKTVSVTTPALTTGQKIMRIVMDSPSFNLNYVTFALNQSPTVSITSPVGGTTFISGNTVTINANASDADGSVTKVEFYVDGTKIGEDATSPYSFDWSATTGIHSLTTVSIDNSGATQTSVAVSITVDNPNQIPTVSITAPVNDAVFTAPASITIKATASDADGSISKVDFYNGTTLLGSDNTSPYSFAWSNVTSGAYVITAKATDNQGAVRTSAEVNITIDAPPSVTLSSPANGATFTEGNNITISANASDTDGSVDRVEFFADGTKIGEDVISPYTISWTAVAGVHALTAKATDNVGVSTTSASISVNVNKAPMVSITSPQTSTVFVEGTVVAINATASDADGNVTSVEFFMDGASIGTDVTSPYSINWTSIKGTHTITAVATDNGNSKTTSTAVTIQVNMNQAPVVNMTSPSDQAIYNPGDIVTISVNASDTDGSISKVEYFVDGTKIGQSLNSPYSYNWTALLGAHTIKTIATDNLGATTSYSVNITVEAPNQAPSVTITSPLNGDRISSGTTVTINVNASDADGSVVNVEFYAGSTKIGEDATSPYSIAWSPLSTGVYNITAKATDNKGAVTTSSQITVTIDTPPVVNISSPSNGTTLIKGDTVSINVNATDSDGTISKVEFFIDGVKIGESTNSPYSISWITTAGNHTILVKVTDELGVSTSSTSVVNVNSAPEVSITSPVDGSVFIEGAQIIINANASDADGNITSVEFFMNGTSIGSDANSPYNISWAPTKGTYSLTAIATDNSNGKTTSSEVVVYVNANQDPEVYLLSPLDQAIYSPGAIVVLKADGEDSDGTIYKVEFFVDGTKVGEALNSPYTMNWIAVNGSHTIRALATDNMGATSDFDDVTILVETANQAPLASITSPSDNSSFNQGETITVNVDATDADGNIANVALYVDDVKVDEKLSAPFTFTLTGVAGDHTLRAVATDNSGSTGTSSSVSITIKANPLGINSGVVQLSFNVYPNPATENLNILFNNEYTGETSLILYDELGKEVAILANGRINSGPLQYNLNALGLRTGVYMIKMVNNNDVKTILFSKE
jgi:chitodextrinase